MPASVLKSKVVWLSGVVGFRQQEEKSSKNVAIITDTTQNVDIFVDTQNVGNIWKLTAYVGIFSVVVFVGCQLNGFDNFFDVFNTVVRWVDVFDIRTYFAGDVI